LGRSICLDTNILYPFPISNERVGTLRSEYELIRQQEEPILTKWEYLYLTDYDLIVSPLAVWEYLSMRLRDISGRTGVREDFRRVLRAVESLRMRFGIAPRIKTLTLALGFLFGAASGIPCDDSYHFVHAIQESADFFATMNKKHFSPCLQYSKEQIGHQMLEILKKNQPVEMLCFPFGGPECFLRISSVRLRKEIQMILKRDWPKIITQPVEVPMRKESAQ